MTGFDDNLYQKIGFENDRSSNLNENENNLLIDYLKKNNLYSLSTAVIQLYLSEKPDHIKWNLQSSGVVCLIKDYNRRSYFFYFYTFKWNKFEFFWEQELYPSLSYNKLTDLYHYFVADDCGNCGFNFLNKCEADKFYDKVISKIEIRKQRVEKINEIKDKNIDDYDTFGVVSSVEQQKTVNSISSIAFSPILKTANVKSYENNEVKNMFKNGNKKLKGSDIIIVRDTFEHREHVGLTSANNFKVNVQNNEIHEMLKQLNIKPNRKTIKKITTYIYKHDGFENFAKIVHDYQKNHPRPLTKPPPIPYSERGDLKPPNKKPPPLPKEPPPLLPKYSSLVLKETEESTYLEAVTIFKPPRPPKPPVPIRNKLLDSPVQLPPLPILPPPPPPPLPPKPSTELDVKKDNSKTDTQNIINNRISFLDQIKAFDPKNLNKIEIRNEPTANRDNENGDFKKFIDDWRSKIGPDSDGEESNCESDFSDS